MVRHKWKSSCHKTKPWISSIGDLLTPVPVLLAAILLLLGLALHHQMRVTDKLVLELQKQNYRLGVTELKVYEGQKQLANVTRWLEIKIDEGRVAKKQINNLTNLLSQKEEELNTVKKDMHEADLNFRKFEVAARQGRDKLRSNLKDERAKIDKLNKRVENLENEILQLCVKLDEAELDVANKDVEIGQLKVQVLNLNKALEEATSWPSYLKWLKELGETIIPWVTAFGMFADMGSFGKV